MSTRDQALALALLASAAPLWSLSGSMAYRGHADHRDVDAVLASDPALAGSPADSCATCHRSGDVEDRKSPGGRRSENHCDYCHAVVLRGRRAARETLNPYGVDYLSAGRGVEAVRAVAARDSDGDGFANEAELRRGTNPGEAGSSPKAPVAPARSYTLAELRKLAPAVEQTVLLNTTKSRSGDTYSDYRGHSAWAVLEGVGLLDTARGVDFLSADGFERTFTLEELQKEWPQGRPVLGLGTADLGECGWVNYRARALDPARPLPPAPILLAFEENGRPLPRATREEATGRLRGAGPLRLIVPQAEPSPPDLPQTADPACAARVAPANRFHEDYDHNGGKSPSAIVAVRVRPLPAGTRDVDWKSGALERLAREEVVFFGAVKPPVENPALSR